MGKHVYIRFFKHKTDLIPVDSQMISVAQNVGRGETYRDYNINDKIAYWLGQYPDGKVDFCVH